MRIGKKLFQISCFEVIIEKTQMFFLKQKFKKRITTVAKFLKHVAINCFEGK